VKHVNIGLLGSSCKGVDLPADHSRGQRACLPYCIDTTSHIDQLFQPVNMHFTDFYIAFAELNVKSNQVSIRIVKQ
jgi:hypothetical protein